MGDNWDRVVNGFGLGTDPSERGWPGPAWMYALLALVMAVGAAVSIAREEWVLVLFELVAIAFLTAMAYQRWLKDHPPSD